MVRKRVVRKEWVFFSIVAFLAVMTTLVISARAEIAQEQKVPEQIQSSGCLSDPKVIEDMQVREAKLKSKEEELVKMADELKLRESFLAEQLSKMEELKKEIGGIEEKQKAKREEQVAKLVESFEKMAPKAMAAMVDQMEEKLAGEALMRMSTDRVAKVMNLMKAEKSSKLSERLMGRRVSARGGKDE